MQIVSENFLNYYLRPHTKKRQNLDDHTFTCKGTWNAKNSMVMDILATELLTSFYSKKVPKKEQVSKFLKESSLYIDLNKHNIITQYKKKVDLDKWYNQLNKTFYEKMISVPISIEMLKEKYTEILREKSIHGIFSLFKQSSQTKFDFKYLYRFKHYFSVFNNPYKNTCYNLFNITNVNRKNDNIQFIVDFKTPLGIYFYFNIISENIRLYPTQLYHLSNDAQFIFRRFIWENKNTDELTIASFLNLHLTEKTSVYHIQHFVRKHCSEVTKCRFSSFRG